MKMTNEQLHDKARCKLNSAYMTHSACMACLAAIQTVSTLQQKEPDVDRPKLLTGHAWLCIDVLVLRTHYLLERQGQLAISEILRTAQSHVSAICAIESITRKVTEADLINQLSHLSASWDNSLNRFGPIIKKLKLIRDKAVAHQDLNALNSPDGVPALPIEEVRNLHVEIWRMCNDLSLCLFDASMLSTERNMEQSRDSILLTLLDTAYWDSLRNAASEECGVAKETAMQELKRYRDVRQREYNRLKAIVLHEEFYSVRHNRP